MKLIDEDLLIDVTVIPKSSRSEIKIDQSNNIKIYLTSAPADGKANSELLKLLSKSLKIPKSSIKIIKGEKNRNKKILISRFTVNDFIAGLKK